MSLIQCAECKKEISDQAATCPSCGAPNAAFKKPMGIIGKLGVVLAIIAAVLVLMVLYGASVNNTPEGQARSKDRNAIGYCDDQLIKLKDDPRMSPAAVGMAADACEKMRTDFRARWSQEP